MSQVALDMDATIVPLLKWELLPAYRSAKGTHLGERGDLPLTVDVLEIGTVASTEMRDGNDPAKEDNRRALAAAVDVIPASEERLRLRSDAAGHGKHAIRFFDRPKSRTDGVERLGAIMFAISATHAQELQAAAAKVTEEDRRPLVRPKRTDPEDGGDPAWEDEELEGEAVAEANSVSDADGTNKGADVVRYVAHRRESGNENGVGEDEIPAAHGRRIVRGCWRLTLRRRAAGGPTDRSRRRNRPRNWRSSRNSDAATASGSTTT